MLYFVFSNFIRMQNLFGLIVVSLFFFGCNDGDIINTTFDFDDASLQYCTGSDSFLFYKINEAKTEAISLLFEGDTNLFIASDTTDITLNSTTNTVNYRIFNGEVTPEYFCIEVPPTSPDVSEEFIGNSGIAKLITQTTYDDMDGLPFDAEGSLDTDEDGILNYFDFDDDGDNVPTLLEIDTENADGDNNPLTNPKDTDGDSIPDYLDDDDDNDGVLTRDEDSNSNLNPTDDITDTAIGPDYLNPNVSKGFNITEYREHSFEFSTDIILTINNLILVNENEQRIYETINLGSIADFLSGTLLTSPDF